MATDTENRLAPLPRGPRAQRAKARILVVEDEAVIALDLERSLTGLGYEVVGLAASSDAALVLAHEEAPDLVLMDITLAGGEDGIVVAEHIGRPVLFLTAHSDPETLARAVRAEPFGYLVKPYNAQELHCAVELALYKRRAEARVRAELEQVARLDPLTGLLNRRGLNERLEQLLKEGRRGRQFVLALADIDHFKQINDSAGHLFGDKMLVAFAAVISSHVRDLDLAARLGGDEFCIALLDCDADHAARVLDRIRAGFAELALAPGLSASFGACRNDPADDAEALLQRADRALYRAKGQGRNRLVMEIEER